MRKKSRKGRDRVGKKISILAHEGVKAPQRIAMALNMEREGRLGPEGQYKRVGRKGTNRKNRQTKRSE